MLIIYYVNIKLNILWFIYFINRFFFLSFFLANIWRIVLNTQAKPKGGRVRPIWPEHQSPETGTRDEDGGMLPRKGVIWSH